MKLRLFRNIRTALLAAFFASPLGAQESPTLPCCIDFDDPNTPGYQISGSAVEDLEIRFPGASGTAEDGYLHAKDDSGASWARLRPDGSDRTCFGDWKHLLEPGRCLELCWDVNLITDGVADVISRPARIIIWSGSERATFITNTEINEDGGWYSFCAPIALANADGTLPSSEVGEWVMNDGDGNPRPEAWNELLCNVDQIAFFVDYHSSQSERWCWDNICLRETACDDCMTISDGRWDCEISPTGTTDLSYTFDVTNQSTQTANVALIPPPTGFTIDQTIIDFDPDLAPGDTGTVTLTFDGITPGSEICFDFVLFNLDEGECCRDEICLKVPCAKISEIDLSCAPGAGNGVDLNFLLTNITGGAVSSAYLVSDDPTVSISPSQVDLTGLANLNSAPVGPININGSIAGNELCLHLVLLDERGAECCFQKLTFTLPQGCEFTTQDENPSVRPARPCQDDDPTLVTSPDRCITLCQQRIECDPENPGCVTYTFTVTNTGNDTMSHLLLPAAGASPSSVIFPTPLAPGEAAQVSVKLTDQVAGPLTFPITLIGLDECVCCHFEHVIEIPECDCLFITNESLECEGEDPDQAGLFCFTYSARIYNLTGAPVDHLFLIPGSPAGVNFTPDHFATGALPSGGFIDITSSVKIPLGTTQLTFTLSLHNADFEECCALENTIPVPECCDCEEDFIFGPVIGGNIPQLPDSISLLNLQQDPDTGKIGFANDGQVRPFPYVYMAASNRGTIVRIDADTGAVLGEYYTSPATNNNHLGNPSRTTVDQFGECWVGNRQNVNPTTQGSVTRIGLAIGGTRGDRLGPIGGPYTFVPNPSGQYLQGPFSYLSPSVVDRDGDGFLRTSAGLTDILAWDPSSTGGDDLGGVTLAEDELVVNYVRIADRVTRALAIDSNNNLFAGGTATSTYDEISGASGAIIGSHTIAGGYGALIDANNVLWSINPSSSVVRYDISTMTTTTTSLPGCYGISIDPCSGNIWVSSSNGNPALLYRVAPDGTLTGSWDQQGRAQGLAVDRNGSVWVSCYSPAQVNRFDLSGTLLSTVGLPIVRSTGVAVDHNGKIWASDVMGDAARRIDPTGPSVDFTSSLGAGSRPYNYSDMTGSVALGAVGEIGSMVVTHNSLCPGTDWGRISWSSEGEDQRNCGISAEVRASDDPLNFPLEWQPVINGASFCPIPGGPQVSGQYVQVRFIFRRPGGCPATCNPRLCRLRIECCDSPNVGVADRAPEIELAQILQVTSGTPISLSAFVSDPDSERLSAQWTINGRTQRETPVSPEGETLLPLPGDNGLYEIELLVTDGLFEIRAESRVSIGDQEAPVVRCDDPRFAAGDLRVTAFETAVPDLRRSTVVSDNVTPSDSLTIKQSPEPSTIVGQGTHLITLSTEDEAGNIGHCELFLIVQPTVAISGFEKYAILSEGEIIEVEAQFNVPLEEIVRTEIIVDGEVVRVIDGPTTDTIPLTLPVGGHDVQVRVFDRNGNSSTTRSRLVRIDPPDSARIIPVGLVLERSSKISVLAKFLVPTGMTCDLQGSQSLEDGSWSHIETVEGTGHHTEIEMEITPDHPIRFFRVIPTADR